MCSLHVLNDAFQTLNGLLIDLNEIFGQLAGQQQLVEQDGAMLPQKLFAPPAPEANVSGIRREGNVGKVLVSDFRIGDGQVRFVLLFHVGSSFRNENSGYDEGFFLSS